jgi:hypothetical protein
VAPAPAQTPPDTTAGDVALMSVLDADAHPLGRPRLEVRTMDARTVTAAVTLLAILALILLVKVIGLVFPR